MGTPPPQAPLDPTAFIPITAEDVARRKRRIVFACVAAGLLAIGAALWIHKRSTDPLNAQEAFDAGRQLMNAARYDQAILSFDRAVSLTPGLADAWLMRGRAHMALYQTDVAIGDFTKSIQARPRDAQQLIERGQAYLLIKNYPAAIADANAAAQIDSKLAEAYNLRGSGARESGNPRKAVEDFSRAVESAPTAENYFQRGETYQQLGDYAHAIEDFSRTISFQPDLPQAYYARAQAERAAGDWRSAEADHQRARILDGQ